MIKPWIAATSAAMTMMEGRRNECGHDEHEQLLL
jgi:hypothetical protein